MIKILASLGESDCETIGDGFLAQPVNALSSLTFSVVGVAILVWAGRAAGRERRFRLMLGLLFVLTGLGSFLYHGPQTAGSLFAHDITFLGTLVVVAITNGALALGWSERRSWTVVAVLLTTYAVILALWPTATNVLTTVSVVLLVASDIPLHRIGGIAGRWYVAALGLLVFALGFFVIGRSGAPLCDADSLLQGHAMWHGLSAVALGAYVVATAPVRERMDRR